MILESWEGKGKEDTTPPFARPTVGPCFCPVLYIHFVVSNWAYGGFVMVDVERQGD